MLYTIEKGKHSAKGFHIAFSNDTEHKLEVCFNENCWYKPLDWENDYNKLFGFTYKLFPKLIKITNEQPVWRSWYNKLLRKIGYTLIPAHHYSSVRIGWRPYAEQQGIIEILLYVYDKGILKVSNDTVLLPTNAHLNFNLFCFTRNEASLYIRQLDKFITLPFDSKPKLGYLLYPFFGGNAPAPHDITLNLTTT